MQFLRSFARSLARSPEFRHHGLPLLPPCVPLLPPPPLPPLLPLLPLLPNEYSQRGVSKSIMPRDET
jgi:hypothetical protein